MSVSKFKRNVDVLKGPFGKGGIHYTVVSILKNAKRPMSVKEITDRVLRVRRIKGKTPGNTVSGVLQQSKYVKRYAYGWYKYAK